MNNLQEILLIKNGELALKGLNRGTFEAVLVKNLKFRLRRLGHFEIRKAQSTVYITPTDDNADMDAAAQAVSRVFGIAAFSRACVVEKDIVAIGDAAIRYLENDLSTAEN